LRENIKLRSQYRGPGLRANTIHSKWWKYTIYIAPRRSKEYRQLAVSNRKEQRTGDRPTLVGNSHLLFKP
jgi:hypothetical protein